MYVIDDRNGCDVLLLNEEVKLCGTAAKFQWRFHRRDTTGSDRHSPAVRDDALVPDWTV